MQKRRISRVTNGEKWILIESTQYKPQMTDFKIPTCQFKLILTISSANEDEGSGSFCEEIMVFRITPIVNFANWSNGEIPIWVNGKAPLIDFCFRSYKWTIQSLLPHSHFNVLKSTER